MSLLASFGLAVSSRLGSSERPLFGEDEIALAVCPTFRHAFFGIPKRILTHWGLFWGAYVPCMEAPLIKCQRYTSNYLNLLRYRKEAPRTSTERRRANSINTKTISLYRRRIPFTAPVLWTFRAPGWCSVPKCPPLDSVRGNYSISRARA